MTYYLYTPSGILQIIYCLKFECGLLITIVFLKGSYFLLQECPEGVVCEDAFKDIYAKFFPHGSKY